MVDIKAIQAAIDRLKVGHMTEASCEALVTRLERAIQDVPICTVPHNCDMLEEHITGGGEHSNIEERLCCLEAAAELAQEKIKALERFQQFADKALKDLMEKPDEIVHMVSTSTAVLPKDVQMTPTINMIEVSGIDTERFKRLLKETEEAFGLATTKLLNKASEQKSEAETYLEKVAQKYQGPKCDRCNAPLGFNAYSSGATPGKTFCGPECAWKAEIEQRLSSLEKHEKCLQCNGLGFVVVGQEISLTGTTVDIQTCQRCGGTGRL